MLTTVLTVFAWALGIGTVLVGLVAFRQIWRLIQPSRKSR